MTIFETNNYKTYLDDKLKADPKGARGGRSRLARFLNCQPGYVSRVLSGSAHFSLEQAEAVNRFLGHTEDESSQFLMQVERDRAGTPQLRGYFDKQLKLGRDRHLNMKERFKIENKLTEIEKNLYYSSWLYAAIHVFATVPKFQDPTTLAAHLKMDLGKLNGIIEDLSKMGLLQVQRGKISVGTARIHLGSDSPLILRHHANWRLQAIRSLERETEKNLHYSSVVSLSAEDIVKIKTILIKSIESIKRVVRDSPEEEVACLSLDFFQL